MSAASPMAEACVSKTSRRQLVRSRNASVGAGNRFRSEEHTSELQHSQISYAVFCLKKKKTRLATIYATRLINSAFRRLIPREPAVARSSIPLLGDVPAADTYTHRCLSVGRDLRYVGH